MCTCWRWRGLHQVESPCGVRGQAASLGRRRGEAGSHQVETGPERATEGESGQCGGVGCQVGAEARSSSPRSGPRGASPHPMTEDPEKTQAQGLGKACLFQGRACAMAYEAESSASGWVRGPGHQGKGRVDRMSVGVGTRQASPGSFLGELLHPIAPQLRAVVQKRPAWRRPPGPWGLHPRAPQRAQALHPRPLVG